MLLLLIGLPILALGLLGMALRFRGLIAFAVLYYLWLHGQL